MYRILVVEDDAIMQRLLRELLAAEGFEVTLCGSGDAALKSATAETPDLVLLDVNLPDISGFEVCSALKSDGRTRHIPVIILTAEAREVAERVRGLYLGADDYLFKPISGKVLTARIRSILRVASKPTK